MHGSDGLNRGGRTTVLVCMLFFAVVPLNLSAEEPIANDQIKSGPTPTDQFQPVPTQTDQIKSGPTPTDQFQPVPTQTDQIKSGPTPTDQFQPVPTRTGPDYINTDNYTGRISLGFRSGATVHAITGTNGEELEVERPDRWGHDNN